MTLLQVSTFSPSLKRNILFNVLFPDSFQGYAGTGDNTRFMPVLILLHGYAGNHFDWFLGTEVQTAASSKNLLVVALSGENNFYLDDTVKEEYFANLVGNEILEKLAFLFGIRTKRETTFLGGYSMGGYGAIRNGFKYHRNFGGIIALSSALIHKKVSAMKPGYRDDYASYEWYVRVFGEPSLVCGSDRDPEALVRDIIQSSSVPTELPRLYLACGTQDFLIAENRQFHEFLTEQGLDHGWVETPGGHDFAFWNTQLKQALDWLMPPETAPAAGSK